MPMPTTQIQPLFKTDVAARLGVSIRTVENLVQRGEIPPPVSIGGRVLWHPEVFNEWLDERLRTQTTPRPHAMPTKAAAGTSECSSLDGKASVLQRKFRARQSKLTEG